MSPSDRFYVNVGYAPPQNYLVIDASNPKLRCPERFEVPSAGPHGLDFDPATKNGLFSSARNRRQKTIALECGEWKSFLAEARA